MNLIARVMGPPRQPPPPAPNPNRGVTKADLDAMEQRLTHVILDAVTAASGNAAALTVLRDKLKASSEALAGAVQHNLEQSKPG